MVSLEPNKARIKQRQEEVMRSALRARNFSEEELTREISDFIKFALSLNTIEIQWPSKEDIENDT